MTSAMQMAGKEKGWRPKCSAWEGVGVHRALRWPTEKPRAGGRWNGIIYPVRWLSPTRDIFLFPFLVEKNRGLFGEHRRGSLAAVSPGHRSWPACPSCSGQVVVIIRAGWSVMVICVDSSLGQF